jgi:hypothetical protein
MARPALREDDLQTIISQKSQKKDCGMRISDCGFKNDEGQAVCLLIRNPHSAFRN